MLFGGKTAFNNLICHLHLPTSSGTHPEFSQRGYGLEVLCSSSTKTLVLSSTYIAQGDMPGPTWVFNVLLLLLLSRSVMSDSLCTKDYNSPCYSVHGTFQAGILEGVAISYSGDPPNPGIKPGSLVSPALAGGIFFFFTRTTCKVLVNVLLSAVCQVRG